jgi:low affinity Fe/Cu permease
MGARMIVRILADLLVVAMVAWLGVLAKAFAEGTLTLAGNDIPWNTILQGAVTIITAALVYVIQKLHNTINSKMDKLLEVVAAKSKAEGILEEKDRQESQRRKP